MRLAAITAIISSSLVALSSAWPNKDANRNDEKKCHPDYYRVDPQHTMCTTKPAKPNGMIDGMPVWEGAKGCVIKFRGFNDIGRNSILEHVNKRRNQVAGGQVSGQPPAANMKKLVWNNELEVIAQRWADQCGWDKPGMEVHDNDHRATSDGTITGQNGYIGKFLMQINEPDEDFYGDYYDYLEEDSNRKIWWENGNIDFVSNETLTEIMQGIGVWTDAWFDEHTKFTNPDNIKHFQFQWSTGHYTQEMWADSGEIGCGWNFISLGLEVGGEWEDFISFMFCNFKPGGNMVGGQIYEIAEPGQSASNCPPGFQKDAEYPNLCSK